MGKCGNVYEWKMTTADGIGDVKKMSLSENIKADVWMVWFDRICGITLVIMTMSRRYKYLN